MVYYELHSFTLVSPITSQMCPCRYPKNLKEYTFIFNVIIPLILFSVNLKFYLTITIRSINMSYVTLAKVDSVGEVLLVYIKHKCQEAGTEWEIKKTLFVYLYEKITHPKW